MKGTLHILTGTTDKKVVPLEIGKYTIGRGEDANIQIASHQVSRKHAEIIVDAQRVTVLDCGSANGTAVNGKHVTTATLRNGDQILIGEVVLEYRTEAGDKPAPRIAVGGPRDGFEPRASMMVAATKVISNKLRPRALWPLFTVIFTIAFVSLAVAATFAFRSLFIDRLTVEAMQRAQGLVRYLAEKNREDLKLNNELLLDVDCVLKERGVREAYIINSKGRIIAPISKLNQPATDSFTQEALAQTGDASILPSPQFPNGVHVFVHPIRAYNDKAGKYQTIGVAKILFSPKDAIGGLEEADRLMYLMLAVAISLAIFLGWATARALAVPLTRLTERIHQWRSGQIFQKEAPPYKDFAPLYDAVDQALDEAQK